MNKQIMLIVFCMIISIVEINHVEMSIHKSIVIHAVRTCHRHRRDRDRLCFCFFFFFSYVFDENDAAFDSIAFVVHITCLSSLCMHTTFVFLFLFSFV
jgi:hypothetical protein